MDWVHRPQQSSAMQKLLNAGYTEKRALWMLEATLEEQRRIVGRVSWNEVHKEIDEIIKLNAANLKIKHPTFSNQYSEEYQWGTLSNVNPEAFFEVNKNKKNEP